MTPICKLTVLFVQRSCLTLSTKGKRLYFTNSNNTNFVVMYDFLFFYFNNCNNICGLDVPC